MTEKEFAERAAPLLATPSFMDLELPPLIETPTALHRVNFKDGVAEIGDLVLDCSKGNILASDIRSISNVNYRKHIAGTVRQSARLHGVFPTLLNEFVPRVNLLVEYDLEQLVYWGVEFHPKQLAIQPKVTWDPFLEKTTWTLILVSYDVDAPKAQYHHWIVGNIPANQLDNGEIISKFLPTSPADQGGLQRYAYVLCSQKAKVDFSSFGTFTTDNIQDRKFVLKDFIKAHALIPKSIVWMHSKADPSVPSMDERISGGVDEDDRFEHIDSTVIAKTLRRNRSTYVRHPSAKSRQEDN